MALNGQVAWITGAGSGIGEAAALALAEAGAAVALSGRSADALEAVAEKVRAAGGMAKAFPLDVSDADAVMAAGAEIASRHGGAVDVLVANAGINVPNRSFAAVTPADFARVVDVDLNGVMTSALAVLPGMRAKGAGTVVMVSSWAGRHASLLTGPAYNAAKHAVVALSHSLNMEEGRHGIRSTVIMPGEVVTPILDRRPVPPSAEQKAKMLQVEDIAEAVRYVAVAPARVCVNEILISPTWNRLFAEAAG